MDVIRINFDTYPDYGNGQLYAFLHRAMRELLQIYAFRQTATKAERYLKYDPDGQALLVKYLKEKYDIDATVWRWDWEIMRNDGKKEIEIIGLGLEFTGSPALTKLLLEVKYEPPSDD